MEQKRNVFVGNNFIKILKKISDLLIGISVVAMFVIAGSGRMLDWLMWIILATGIPGVSLGFLVIHLETNIKKTSFLEEHEIGNKR